MAFISRLETTERDIHPVLRKLAKRFSGELNLDYIFWAFDDEHVALNLAKEATGEKRTIGIAPRSATIAKSGHRLVTSMTSDALQEDVYRYFAEVCYLIHGKNELRFRVLRMGLEGVDDDSQGLIQLQNIADDLRRVYEYTYHPDIYKHGVFWR
jgi:hypothetical protein